MPSSVVVKTPCFCNSFLSPSSMFNSLPSQHSLHPRPSQTGNQQKQKDHQRNESTSAQARERNRKRQQKNRLHIKDQENDGVEIILRLELNPRVAFGLETTLVGGVLFLARLTRRKLLRPQPRQQ